MWLVYLVDDPLPSFSSLKPRVYVPGDHDASRFLLAEREREEEEEEEGHGCVSSCSFTSLRLVASAWCEGRGWKIVKWWWIKGELLLRFRTGWATKQTIRVRRQFADYDDDDDAWREGVKMLCFGGIDDCRCAISSSNIMTNDAIVLGVMRGKCCGCC